MVSPGGSKIAYCKYDAKKDALQVFVSNPDGSDAKQITDSGSFKDVTAWFPDGKKLVYKSGDRRFFGHRGVHIINSDGTNDQILNIAEQLTNQKQA